VPEMLERVEAITVCVLFCSASTLAPSMTRLFEPVMTPRSSAEPVPPYPYPPPAPKAVDKLVNANAALNRAAARSATPIVQACFRLAGSSLAMPKKFNEESGPVVRTAVPPLDLYQV
jgi:hypothetical protein